MTITITEPTPVAERPRPMRPAKVTRAVTVKHAGKWFWRCRAACPDGYGWEDSMLHAHEIAWDHVSSCNDARAMLAATAGLAS